MKKNLRYLLGTTILGLVSLVNSAKSQEMPVIYEKDRLSKVSAYGENARNTSLSTNWISWESDGNIYAISTQEKEWGFRITNSGNAKNPSMSLDRLLYQDENSLYLLCMNSFLEDMKIRESMEPEDVNPNCYMNEILENHKIEPIRNLNSIIDMPKIKGDNIVFIANEEDNKNIYRYSISRRRLYPIETSESDKKSLDLNDRFIVWAQRSDKPESHPSLLPPYYTGDYDAFLFDIETGERKTIDDSHIASTDAITISNVGIAYANNKPYVRWKQPENNLMDGRGMSRLNLYYPLSDVKRGSEDLIAGLCQNLSLSDYIGDKAYLLGELKYNDSANINRMQTLLFLPINDNSISSDFLDPKAREKLFTDLHSGEKVDKLAYPDIHQSFEETPILSYIRVPFENNSYQSPEINIVSLVPRINTQQYLQSFVENYARHGEELPSDLTGDGTVGEEDYRLIFGE